MVIRKPVPPQRDPSGAPAQLPYPVSPTSPRSHDVNPFDISHTPYSTNLAQSPAFDLQPLEEAQQSPVHRLGSVSGTTEANPWADEDTSSAIPAPLRPGSSNRSSMEYDQSDSYNKGKAPEMSLPASLRPGPPVGSVLSSSPSASTSRLDTAAAVEASAPRLTPQGTGFQSNNPFAQAASPVAEVPQIDIAPPSAAPSTTTPLSRPYSKKEEAGFFDQDPVPSFSGLSMSGQPEGHRAATAAPPYPHESEDDSWVQRPGLLAGSQPSYTSRPPVPKAPNLMDDDQAAWDSATPGTTHTPASDQENAPLPPPPPPQHVEPEVENPPLPVRPKQPQIDWDAERNTTLKTLYNVRRIVWTDSLGDTREVPMLSQNKNGPCPLLALVNALVLQTRRGTEHPIINALLTREQISLQLLIEVLFDELITRGQTGYLDVDDLKAFLFKLHTGMMVDPRLAVDEDATESAFFEKAIEIEQYEGFGVSLLHGWLVEPGSDVDQSIRRLNAFSYDGIRDRQFQTEFITEHQSSDPSMKSPQTRDLETIIRFIEVDAPTQLSSYGQYVLMQCVPPGDVAVLFRNDHFVTIYHHPHLEQLLMLATDEGLVNQKNIVWETLTPDGGNSQFFNSNFEVAVVEGRDLASPSSRQPDEASASAAVSNTEQMDADFAMALHLQEQEEAAREEARREARRRRSFATSTPSSPINARHNHNRTSSSISQQNRPPLPARNTTNQTTTRPLQNARPGVNRPAPSSTDEAPPPTYEQAASGPRYNPPPGHPLSTTSNIVHPPPMMASANGQQTGITAGPGQGQQRISVQQQQAMIARRQDEMRRQQARERGECVVM